MVKRRNDKALGTTPAALLAGKEDVERAFDGVICHRRTASTAGRYAERQGIELQRHPLGFDLPLAALEIFDNFGQRTVDQLAQLERNPKLAPDLFKFTPPQGADVIGD